MMCFNREWQRGFSCKNDSGQKWTKLQYLKNTALGFLMAQLVKNPPTMWETWIPSLCWEDPLEKRKGYPLQYSGLGNSLDCIVHGVAKSWKRLSDFHFHFLQNFVVMQIKKYFLLIKILFNVVFCCYALASKIYSMSYSPPISSVFIIGEPSLFDMIRIWSTILKNSSFSHELWTWGWIFGSTL